MALLNEITIGETCFFRNQPQLDALRHIVIPSILQAKSDLPLRRLRFWSAGCSTGEEPYTLRMLLLEGADACSKTGPSKSWPPTSTSVPSPMPRAAVYGDYSTRNLTPIYRRNIFFRTAISFR